MGLRLHVDLETNRGPTNKLYVRIDSWKVNMGKVFSGINKQKPGMIKKGLKEIKILNKKIEDMIEDLV